VYGSKRISELILRKGVVPIKVDLTSKSQRTSAGTRLLEALGGRSIPFMTLHPPGEAWNRPWRFRDLVTRGEVARVLVGFPEVTIATR
jgi:hypothetical protein